MVHTGNEPYKANLCNWNLDIFAHGQAEFRGTKFFPDEIFCSLIRISDSVNDAESYDIKILT